MSLLKRVLLSLCLLAVAGTSYAQSSPTPTFTPTSTGTATKTYTALFTRTATPLPPSTSTGTATHTPTSTPTATNTGTVTNTPTATGTTTPTSAAPRPFGGGVAPMAARLLNSATTAVTGAPVYVGSWPSVAIQVAPAAGCSAFNLQVEALLGGTTYGVVKLDGGAVAITQAEAAASSAPMWVLPRGLRYVRVKVNSITTCTLSVYLAAGP